MSSELLIRHCSPTLANLKTANMFSCEFESLEELKGDLRNWNHKLSKKGLRIIPLRVKKNHCLVYVFRPNKLSKDLNNNEAQNILRSRGYTSTNPNRCLAELKRKLLSEKEFPHEIGLFLGYPVEDVDGFIKDKKEGCKLVGTWKVYGDLANAKKVFARFKKCSKLYYEEYLNGRTVDRLTVRA